MENKFEDDKMYRLKCVIWTPTGFYAKGIVHTGKEWKEYLVYEVSENSFGNMFEIFEPK